ncbi:MAG: ferredoxin [Frankiaceae bacterium]|nr:ferredoxin [Frankiaceae bacterium]
MSRLVVDWGRCDGHGLCGVLLPELVDLDDWGFPVVGVDVPDDLHPAAKTAVRSCPALALRLHS